MDPQRLPRLFVRAADRRWLIALAALTLLSGAAMLPAMSTMADHGASLSAFENAGSVERSAEIVSEWGSSGKAAMWWQLALDVPFVVGFGLFIAGACASVCRRAAVRGKHRLARAAAVIAWSGPLAASIDLLQDISLAIVLAGHVDQPWPRIAALTGRPISVLVAVGLIFALVGAILTRPRAAAEFAGGLGDPQRNN